MISKLFLSSMLVMTSVPIYEQAYAAESVKSSAISASSVIKKQVNFRNAPSTKSLIIGKLVKGEQVEILDKVNAYWYKVKDTKQRTGYVSASYVTVETSSTKKPTVTQPIVEAAGTAKAVINAGMKYLGTPYEFGSNRNTVTTFDCSDFVRQAFMEGAGIKLPADSRQQGQFIRNKGNVKTNWRDLKPGDIMFFMSYKGSNQANYSNVNKFNERITHDGIYLGNGKILHTYSKESGGVRIDTIEGKHWEKRFLYGGSAL